MTPSATTPKIEFVGKVISKLKKLADCPKQGREGAPEAWIQIGEKYIGALRGIRTGEELLLFTWLHKADRDTLVVHPRGNPENPLSGVFITRSPSRPNPIGLHRVTVLEIKDSRLMLVAPLEALDGTPVIDIKSVMKEA